MFEVGCAEGRSGLGVEPNLNYAYLTHWRSFGQSQHAQCDISMKDNKT